MADVKTEPADIEEIATIIEEHDVKKGESFQNLDISKKNWTKRYDNWFEPDVGGQHCPCPVLVSFLSGFSGKSYPILSAFRILSGI